MFSNLPEGVRVDLSVFQAKAPGTRCTVPGILDKLTDEQRGLVKRALADGTIPTSGIHRKVVEWSGVKVSQVTIARHRNHGCRCPHE